MISVESVEYCAERTAHDHQRFHPARHCRYTCSRDGSCQREDFMRVFQWATLLILALGLSHGATGPALRTGMVVTFHPLATQVGVQILDQGGNAFDAFIGATFAEYVVNEGGTSLAGSLGALVYDAKSGETQYLDGEFNSVSDPSGSWNPSRPWSAEDGEAGKAVLVPGAIASLEAMSKRYGRLRFQEVLQPAIALARDGFKVQGFYRAALLAGADFLRRTDYGSRTFFPNGHVLSSGEVLRQPELAGFLEQIARQGASYMYRGAWAAECVKAVKARGGRMTVEDLARYEPAWHETRTAAYRGYEVHSPSGRDFGGLWGLVALKTLEHTNIARLGHYSTSAAALEVMVRTARESLAEPWIFDYRQLDDAALVQSKLTSDYTASIWARVAAKLAREPSAPAGSHSYQIIVVDHEGNAVTGTNTHESLAWGSGIFVQGVPLNTAGRIPWRTNPGERQISPFSMNLVLKGKKLVAASGSFSGSILEASFEFLVNLIDYRLPAHEIVNRPRFGTFPYDPAAPLIRSITERLNANTPNWLDPRVDSKIVQTLAMRGLYFEQGYHAFPPSWVDTGMGSVVVIHPDGTPEGANTPWVEISGPPGAVESVPVRSRH